MVTLQTIKSELSDIRYYYARREMFEKAFDCVGLLVCIMIPPVSHKRWTGIQICCRAGRDIPAEEHIGPYAFRPFGLQRGCAVSVQANLSSLSGLWITLSTTPMISHPCCGWMSL